MDAPHHIVLPVRAKWWIFRYWRRQHFEFNMAAWFALYQEYGWDFDQIGKIPPEELSAKMIYQAARQGNFSIGKPFTESLDRFLISVGDMRNADGGQLKRVFTESAQLVSEQMAGIGKQSKKKITWDDVLAIAFGEIGLDPAVFRRMSLKEWLLTQRGFFKAKEDAYRNGWEQARLLGFWAGNMGWKKGTKPRHLITFEWDSQKAELPTLDEMEYWVKKYGRFMDSSGRSWN